MTLIESLLASIREIETEVVDAGNSEFRSGADYALTALTEGLLRNGLVTQEEFLELHNTLNPEPERWARFATESPVVFVHHGFRFELDDNGRYYCASWPERTFANVEEIIKWVGSRSI